MAGDETSKARPDEPGPNGRAGLGGSGEKYEKLFRATPMGIALSTRDSGRILEVNEGFEELVGYSREELVGRRAAHLGLWAREEDREALLDAVRTRGRVRELDVRFRRSDGRVILGETFAEAIEVEGRECLLTVTRDVTEERRRERELARSRDELWRYADHLTSDRERERRELARDIHDHLAQLLTAVRMKLVRLAGAAGEERNLSPDDFEDLVRITDRGIEEVRNISTSLRPCVLERQGLVGALRWLAGRASARFGLRITLESDLEEIELPGERTTHVFRVVQEALTNVGRHADAERAQVLVERGDDTVVVRVLDDGVGLGAAREGEPAETHGLVGMEERARVLGGDFSLRERPERGTEVRLEFPHLEGADREA